MYGKQESEFTRQATRVGHALRQPGRPAHSDAAAGGPRATVPTAASRRRGVFPNSQFMLEFRPYIEESEFWGTNPGMTWQIADKLNLDVQGNYTKSEFHREASTVLFISDTTTVNYSNTGGDTPTITSSVDLNDPDSWQWLVTDRGGTDVGRVNLQDEERETETAGGRFALTWGDSAFSVSAGGAYDEVSRDIRPSGADAQWQAQVCGGNPRNFQLSVRTRSRRAAARRRRRSLLGAGDYPAYAAPVRRFADPECSGAELSASDAVRCS